jgi:hypothetical protein
MRVPRMKRVTLDPSWGETLFIVNAADVETIRDLCAAALKKDPTDTRVLRLLKGVSPYDKALPRSKRKRIPR